MAEDNDPVTGLPLATPIVVELSLSQWRVVLAHLGRGMYSEVAEILKSIYSQGDTQLLILMNHARAAKALAPSEVATTSASVH